MSPEARFLAECREDVTAYLKTHPEPIGPHDLLRELVRQAEVHEKPPDSSYYGDVCNKMTRRSAYCCIFTSLNAQGLVTYTADRKYMWKG